MANINITISGIKGLQTALKQVEKEVRNGIDDGAKNLIDSGKAEAIRVIALNDINFSGELFNSFDNEYSPSPIRRAKTYYLVNTALHAPIIEKGGVRPHWVHRSMMVKNGHDWVDEKYVNPDAEFVYVAGKPGSILVRGLHFMEQAFKVMQASAEQEIIDEIVKKINIFATRK